MFDIKVPININQGGFATVDDVIKNGVKIDYTCYKSETAGVTMISDGKTSQVLDDDGFYLTVGGTGSKKTRDVVAPYIYNNALAGNSMIISDVKGDLYKLLVKRLRKMGYRIVVLDFNEPERGDAYNPLLSIYRDYKSGKLDKANRELNNIAEMIFCSMKSEKDPFWHSVASSYFVGCVLTIFELFDEEYVTIENALNLHIQGEKKFGGSTYMKEYYSDKEMSEAWKLLVSTVNAPNETKASIHSVYTSALNKLIGQNQGLIKMTSYSTFEISDIVDHKTAVFIISNEESLSVHSGLITALIQQWYDVLVNLADKTNGVLDRNVVFVLDEFGNLPAIKDFQTKISLSRARGISWMIVLQSFAQLDLRYGKEVARTIIGNTANWIYLFSPDLELLTHISNLCGEVTDEYTGLTRKLLSVNQLRHFQKCNEEGKTECLMLLARMNPFITYLPDISEYYGIDSIDFLDIPIRDEKEVGVINFGEIVMAGKKKKIDEEMEKVEKERQEYKEKMEIKMKNAKKCNPYSLTEVMEDVISDLVGGMK